MGSLSPTLTLFLDPYGKLYLKLQQVLAQLELDTSTPLPPTTRKRPGPAKPKPGIPQKEWPNVVMFLRIFGSGSLLVMIAFLLE